MKSMTSLGLVFLLSVSFSMAGFTMDEASTREESKHFWEDWNIYIRSQLAAPDPWESWNRKVFAFNDFVDRNALAPTARAYQSVTPDPLERGVGNFFNNLTEITTVFNDLLQFKFTQAASDTSRFAINSTVGLIGFFDVATGLGLEKHTEDFGQTLGSWGVNTGPYIMMPFLGPFTLRDGVGAFADSYTDLVMEVDHIPTRNQLLGTRLINTRASLFAAEELVSGDRYAFIRDIYLQRREFMVNDGVIEDNFGEEDWDDDWDEE